ncbi:hypothetical protein FNV43_RR04024 [Rhamnella rubrinervis]|uniref:Uncharacterized protein n=1 Tax=Rhamnella rubrinervis TaxID=2594499 RepID=A0A8K0HL17_9ROSA|nr:hypothetical protein FNV43_RR04024 [Rhamnella rubrinervis]
MGKIPCCDKSGLKKGPWTPEEDQKLVDYIQKYGHGRWRTLPKNAGLKRCGKSCRLRWTNYLRPDIKRGRFSFEEEETIIQLHSVLGNKWSAIAARLPGRTDNEIKNYWNTHIRKRLLKMGIDPVTHSPRLDLLELSSILSSTLYNNNSSQLNVPNMLGIGPILNPNLLNLATALLSCQSSESPAAQFPSQDLQQNQLGQAQNQFQPFQTNQIQNHIRDIQTCTTSTTTSSVPYTLNETQLMQAKMDQQLSSAPQNLINFRCPTNSISTTTTATLWQNSNHREDSNTPESLFSILNNGYHHQESYQPIINSSSSLENQAFVSNNNNTPNMRFSTLLSSAPSSYATTPLNSSSITYVNSSNNEDERDSFCSNFMMYDIPNALNVDEFS